MTPKFQIPKEVRVYVHAKESYLRNKILKGSAVVGFDPDTIDPDNEITVYYEGNFYNAANLNTFEEKCLCAADRMLTNYPTLAFANVLRSELLWVGWFNLETKALTLGEWGEEIFEEWIDIDSDNNITEEDVHKGTY